MKKQTLKNVLLTRPDSIQLEDEDFLYESDDESSLPSTNEEPTIVGKPGPKSKKLARKSGKKIKANFIDDNDVTQSLADIIEREEKKMQAEDGCYKNCSPSICSTQSVRNVRTHETQETYNINSVELCADSRKGHNLSKILLINKLVRLEIVKVNSKRGNTQK